MRLPSNGVILADASESRYQMDSCGSPRDMALKEESRELGVELAAEGKRGHYGAESLELEHI